MKNYSINLHEIWNINYACKRKYKKLSLTYFEGRKGGRTPLKIMVHIQEEKLLNQSLTIIQKQLNDTLSAAQNIQTIFSMWCIHAIFVDVEKAAQLVLDILAGWAATAQTTKDKVKQAAKLLIDFQQKGI